MRRLFNILCILLVSLSNYAQETEPNYSNRNTSKKAIYLGIAGPNLMVGPNFDFRFNPGELGGWGMRLGLGIYNYPRNVEPYKITSVIIGVNSLSRTTKHHLLTGVGIMPSMVKESTNLSNSSTITNIRFGAYFEAGYRYQSPDNGFFFQLSFTPLILAKEFAFFLWGGIGFGYTFW